MKESNENKKVSLINWYKKSIQYPILAIVSTVFISTSMVTLIGYYQKIISYKKSVELASQIISNSLTYKDRKLSELTLNSLMISNQFSWIAICKNSEAIILLSNESHYNDYCANNLNDMASLLFLKKALYNIQDHYLIAKFSIIEITYPITILVILLIILVVFLKNTYSSIFKKINRDIVTPINYFSGIDTLTTKMSNFKIRELEHIYLKIQASHKLEIENAKSLEMANIATQVAHDIRSPLSVINMIGTLIKNDINVEKYELLIQSSQRLNEIADDLLKKGMKKENKKSIDKIIDQIIIEKELEIKHSGFNYKIQFINNIDQSKYLKILDSDISRIISNILNNSLESLQGKIDGQIQIKLFEDDQTIIEIIDNGCGISEDIIGRIGEKGFTSGKINGNGLGIYHAQSVLSKFNGSMQITSTLNSGTTIRISL